MSPYAYTLCPIGTEVAGHAMSGRLFTVSGLYFKMSGSNTRLLGRRPGHRMGRFLHKAPLPVVAIPNH